MFRQPIANTALTSDAANNYFTHIQGGTYNGDATFLSTLRALIAPRMSEGESLFLQFSNSNYGEDTLKNNTPNRIIDAICRSMNVENNGVIHIHNVNSVRQDDNTICLDILKSNFARVKKGWNRLTKVTDLFRTQFYTLCFVNPDLKSVVVFVDSLNTSKMHYLQCAILGFFPWYFSPEKGVSQEEMNLINTLRGKDPDAYSNCIAQLAERYDFRTERIKQLLAGFETRFERLECERVRNEIQHTLNTLRRLQDDISNQLQRKNDFEIRLLGLEAKIASGGEESEIMDYFLHNRKLDLIYVDDRILEFIVKDYITYFDEDVARRTIDNSSSYVYDYIEDFSEEDVKKLMYAIFINQDIKIKVCAAYRFRLNGSVEAMDGYSFGNDYREYMPNPHIQRYSCMGNYIRAIDDALIKHDYISALEQTIASAKSLNFTDSTVMEAFMGDLLSNRRWLELPDGSVVTPTEALKWIDDQNRGE